MCMQEGDLGAQLVLCLENSASVYSQGHRILPFFFSFFGLTTAHGVPRLGIRSKLQLQWQHQIHNPLCQDQGSNLHPSAPKTPPILLHHRGSSHNPFLLMSCLVPTW